MQITLTFSNGQTICRMRVVLRKVCIIILSVKVSFCTKLKVTKRWLCMFVCVEGGVKLRVKGEGK